jgi:hypothetical protein
MNASSTRESESELWRAVRCGFVPTLDMQLAAIDWANNQPEAGLQRVEALQARLTRITRGLAPMSGALTGAELQREMYARPVPQVIATKPAYRGERVGPHEWVDYHLHTDRFVCRHCAQAAVLRTELATVACRRGQ